MGLCVSAHLVNRGTDSFCSGLSFQEYFRDKETWKIRNIAPSMKEGRFVGCPYKDNMLHWGKGSL